MESKECRKEQEVEKKGGGKGEVAKKGKRKNYICRLVGRSIRK